MFVSKDPVLVASRYAVAFRGFTLLRSHSWTDW